MSSVRLGNGGRHHRSKSVYLSLPAMWTLPKHNLVQIEHGDSREQVDERIHQCFHSPGKIQIGDEGQRSEQKTPTSFACLNLSNRNAQDNLLLSGFAPPCEMLKGGWKQRTWIRSFEEFGYMCEWSQRGTLHEDILALLLSTHC